MLGRDHFRLRTRLYASKKQKLRRAVTVIRTDERMWGYEELGGTVTVLSVLSRTILDLLYHPFCCIYLTTGHRVVVINPARPHMSRSRAKCIDTQTTYASPQPESAASTVQLFLATSNYNCICRAPSSDCGEHHDSSDSFRLSPFQR